MGVYREFLGWERPFLEGVAGYFLEMGGASGDGVVDLRDCVLVLPGRRGGRRLLELLAKGAEDKGCLLLPPVFLTLGVFPEYFYSVPRAVANGFVRQWAWVRVMREFGGAGLKGVFPNFPDDGDFASLLGFAEQFERVWREVSAAGLDFSSVIAEGFKGVESYEANRWRLLSDLHSRYLSVLESGGYCDVAAERITAIRDNLFSFDKRVFLIALPDLDVVFRRIIDLMGERATALIFAPRDEASSFDGYGCVDVEAWSGRSLEFPEGRVRFLTDPAAQAAELQNVLRGFSGRFSVDEVSIGVCDQTLVPFLFRALDEIDVAVHRVPGESFSQSELGKGIRAIVNYLSARDFDSFATLVRHPAIYNWLIAELGEEVLLLESSDEFQKRTLPQYLSFQHVSPEVPVSQIHHKLSTLLGDFIDGNRSRSFLAWSQSFRDLLTVLYGDLEPDDTILSEASFDLFLSALGECESLGVFDDSDLKSKEFLNFLWQQLSKQALIDEPKSDSLELLGWLELPLDDAPGLVVVGMNEGLVPEALNSDLFLPNSLRTMLGMLDNHRRFARDAFAYTALLNSKSDVHFLCGRHSASGEALLPSRLLLAGDAEGVAGRVVDFFSEEIDPAPNRLSESNTGLLYVPAPEPVNSPIAVMSVSSFADYICCPYRFYLKHVLSLRKVDGRAQEMDPPLFGEVLHEVLSLFAKSSARNSANVGEIVSQLDSDLDFVKNRRFGREPLPAVLLQCLQIQARLHVFAEWQAERRRAGWAIEYAEYGISETDFSLDIGEGRRMGVRARIDRIDLNEQTGEREVIDYKSGERAIGVEAAHLTAEGEWKNLQLPLYRAALRAKKFDDPMRFGFFQLSKESGECVESWAGWSAEEFDSAIDAAREIASAVQHGEFWPPNEFSSSTDEFSFICGEEIPLVEGG